MYAGGFGVAQDKLQGYKWLTIAVDLGDTDAIFNRDNVAALMSEEEITAANRQTIEWMESYQNLLAKH